MSFEYLFYSHLLCTLLFLLRFWLICLLCLYFKNSLYNGFFVFLQAFHNSFLPMDYQNMQKNIPVNSEGKYLFCLALPKCMTTFLIAWLSHSTVNVKDKSNSHLGFLLTLNSFLKICNDILMATQLLCIS